MTDPVPGEAAYKALLELHAASGAGAGTADRARRVGVPRMGPAMRTVVDAPAAIPLSARLGALFDLERSEYSPEPADQEVYRELAGSVAESGGVDVDELLGDLRRAARGAVPFSETASGQSLPHHDTAFIGESVCTTRRVEVGGLDAIWIFSEFETDAPFADVAGWVDPRNWPDRGPLMFKAMDLVGSEQPVRIRGLGDDHWHGVFHEEVRLVRDLNTLLHCDHWRDGDSAAGMTYRLDVSLDDQIDVDQGYLSVNNAGPVCRVKALKVVSFTEDVWDEVALHVCPFWTDWMRGAVRAGNKTVPKAPTDADGPGSAPLSGSLQAWMEFFGDSSREYLELFDDVSSRVTSGRYSASDWLSDGTRYWLQLAKDWSRAWAQGVETMNQMAREGVDLRVAPSGAATRGGTTAAASTTSRGPTALEGTLVPIEGLAENDRVTSPELVSIEAGGATIAARDVRVTVEHLGGGAYGVRLWTTDASVPAGLYVGRLATAGGRPLGGVQLYVSRATEVVAP
jgi:hypothetical protein